MASNMTLEARHKIFLSHSGVQKFYVEYLCKELESCLRYPFFDIRTHSLQIGENFPDHIFEAIQQCYVRVVVLSKEFLTSKWPMIELVAMVEEARKRENFRIIPVCLQISPRDLSNAENQKQWRDCWADLGAKNDGRVEVEKCEAALKYLRSLNCLVNNGSLDFEFLNKVVDAICEIVPPQIKLDDSYIEGKARLCQVIWDKIDLQVASKNGGVCMMGLYGMGGMGKTTICKVLCNEFITKFHGRVCHAELETHGEEKLLRDVLKRQEQLNGFNLSELHNGLRSGEFLEAPVFLALDNMSDSNSTITEAKRYLSAKLPNGRIILVTSRSKESLILLRPFINENECIKMPELEEEEARALFIKSCEGRNKDDQRLIHRCVQRCRFRKDSGETSYDHYHPLALSVLGRELARLDDPRDWNVQLDMIDKDIFNQTNDRDHHPIFSILRKSFDTLSKEDQLLFIDVAFFFTDDILNRTEIDSTTLFQWLGEVNKITRLEDVIKGLERLKRKSLLESVGGQRCICIHDLWREFCTVETKHGEWRSQQFVYERNTCRDYPESASEEPIAEQIGRLKELLGLRLICYKGGKLPDMRHIISLRTAVFIECKNVVTVAALSSNLRVLSFAFCPNLQSCPGVGDLIALEELMCIHCQKLESLPNLRRLRKLQILKISGCDLISELLGVGDLVALEELHAHGCKKLSKLPDLRKLINLRVIDLAGCNSLVAAFGLDNMISLQEVVAEFQEVVDKPNHQRLCKLQKVWINGWSPAGIQGLNNLTNLQDLKIGCCSGVDALPSYKTLTQLRSVTISSSAFKDVSGLSNLSALESLVIMSCENLEWLPNFQKFTRLKVLSISGCAELRRWNSTPVEQVEGWLCRSKDGISNSETVSSLEELRLQDCGFLDLEYIKAFLRMRRLEMENLPVRVLPDLSCFPGLKTLLLHDCKSLETLTVGAPMAALSRLVVEGCQSLATLPDLSKSFPKLSELTVKRSDLLTALISSRALTTLTMFEVKSCHDLTALPNLGMFPALEWLNLENCRRLMRLSSSVPLTALRELTVESCNSLVSLLDLRMFPALEELAISGCSQLNALDTNVPLTVLTSLEVKSCSSLKEVPNLAMFPALERLVLCGCTQLMALRCSVPLMKLKLVDVRGCSNLSGDDLALVSEFCPECKITAVENAGPKNKSAECNWRSRVLGLCGALVTIGILNFTRKRWNRTTR